MARARLASIFSSPLSSVCTCHSLTSFSSRLAWMCVLATHSSCRLPPGSAGAAPSSASSTRISATLSFISRLSSFLPPFAPSASLSDAAALLNSTSYFFTSAKRLRLKNVAQPSIAYALPVNTCAVFFLYTAL